MSTESTIDDLRELRDEPGTTPSTLSRADSLRLLISALITMRENHPDTIPAADDGAREGQEGVYTPRRATNTPRRHPGRSRRWEARRSPQTASGTLDAWAATADALEAERDDWKRKTEKPYIDHRRCEAWLAGRSNR